ncbi:hypothetical protein [Bradyrhizobium elkanii]|uniref:Uncharacterized protein n=1 Tax=Bradyrhizobium elkanii TaxID=29448 RepID=A0ABV4F3I6_BRAEL|nr:hypothetical protein [Bradyrhizobium elkanii]MCS3577212.1 hypothetical protein [Bradyrhizobium elkanii]MCS3720089.1 hypothetical protein [Bradyrhizobium elkanii]MCS3890481.1 hypothetical protein [Bradyrhizobium elkanii]MCS4004506.1 hypothetical protein [Bradyrhizobium elkanii USDA 61]MCS4219919.1 hypothetical protein [Bradyrhizobium elkanii]
MNANKQCKQELTDLDAIAAEKAALDFIVNELARQNEMWGPANERVDVSNGELFQAGVGQLDAVFDRRNHDATAFDEPPQIYPENWSGFRSYGGDFPNIGVGVTFLIQEMKRLAMNGEDLTRLSRRPDQAYNPETGLPNPVSA